jgi:hypothetical protein
MPKGTVSFRPSPSQLGRETRKQPTGAALLFRNAKLSGCHSRNGNGICDAVFCDFDDLMGHNLANRVVAIHKVQIAKRAVERQFDNVTLLGREIPVFEQWADWHGLSLKMPRASLSAIKQIFHLAKLEHHIPARPMARRAGTRSEGWWGRKDSNLRSHEAADLQSAPFATRDTPPYHAHCALCRRLLADISPSMTLKTEKTRKQAPVGRVYERSAMQESTTLKWQRFQGSRPDLENCLGQEPVRQAFSHARSRPKAEIPPRAPQGC